jgi:uncharacterized membrane protein
MGSRRDGLPRLDLGDDLGLRRLRDQASGRVGGHLSPDRGGAAARGGRRSLVAVGFVLATAGGAAPLDRAVLIALAVASVVLAWTTVYMVFTLRYARLYYAAPVGGIDFRDVQLPDYSDFAYVAFTIGMTFQISDTDLAKRPIRRTVLHQTFLSYLFGSVVLAITVSLVASILGSSG